MIFRLLFLLFLATNTWSHNIHKRSTASKLSQVGVTSGKFKDQYIPKNYFPEIEYPSDILEVGKPFYFKSPSDVLGAFPKEVRNSFQSIAAKKNSNMIPEKSYKINHFDSNGTHIDKLQEHKDGKTIASNSSEENSTSKEYTNNDIHPTYDTTQSTNSTNYASNIDMTNKNNTSEITISVMEEPQKIYNFTGVSMNPAEFENVTESCDLQMGDVETLQEPIKTRNNTCDYEATEKNQIESCVLIEKENMYKNISCDLQRTDFCDVEKNEIYENTSSENIKSELQKGQNQELDHVKTDGKCVNNSCEIEGKELFQNTTIGLQIEKPCDNSGSDFQGEGSHITVTCVAPTDEICICNTCEVENKEICENTTSDLQKEELNENSKNDLQREEKYISVNQTEVRCENNSCGVEHEDSCENTTTDLQKEETCENFKSDFKIESNQENDTCIVQTEESCYSNSNCAEINENTANISQKENSCLNSECDLQKEKICENASSVLQNVEKDFEEIVRVF